MGSYSTTESQITTGSEIKIEPVWMHHDDRSQITKEPQIKEPNQGSQIKIEPDHYGGFIKTKTERIKPFTDSEHVEFICESIRKDVQIKAPILECTVIHWDWEKYAALGPIDNGKIESTGFLEGIINIPNSKGQPILYVACQTGNCYFVSFILNCDSLDFTLKSFSTWNFLDALFFNDNQMIGYILKCFGRIFKRVERIDNLIWLYDLLYDKSMRFPPMYQLCRMMGDYSDSIFQEFAYMKNKKISHRDHIVMIRKNIKDVLLNQYNNDEKMRKFLCCKLKSQT